MAKSNAENQRAYRERKAAKLINPTPATAWSTDKAVVIDGSYGTPPITNPKGRKDVSPPKQIGKAVTPEAIAEAVDNKGKLKRDTAPKGNWHNPYNDGLPDWPELIQRMTQKQRDEILAKINKGSKF